MRGARLLPGPAGDLEVLTTGRGRPHTVLAHGLTGTIGTTRPYATKVAGARTFFHVRGHGDSAAPPAPWGYADLAAELWAVADAVGADRALGVSLGAGALCTGLARDPQRFSRVVLVIPAALDRPRTAGVTHGFTELAAQVEAGDVEAVTHLLVGEQPGPVRRDPAVVRWCREQAEELVAMGEGLVTALRVLPGNLPLPNREALAEVTCPVLVLAQESDETHPVEVARELAEVLPQAVLHVAGPGGLMWEHRSHTRDLVGDFLSAP